MTGDNKDDPALAALVANVRGEPIGPLITRTEAAKEIAEALKIDHKAAMMTLYGLCATGDVRWFDDSGEIVDEDSVTIAAFAAKPVFIVADHVRHWLVEWSPDPQPKRREQVIQTLLAEGLNPPRNIQWKPFCDLVCNKCNGWLAPGKPALGFGEKQIMRIVKELRP
jgi:hypothetical protein